jgi:HAD superfamily hydrolase (TIGR01484 family)
MNNEDKIQTLPKALAFDLDGTLAPSKSHLESDMAEVFSNLLKYIPMAVVSGASKDQFLHQFINYLPQEGTNFSNLYIFPENGASLEIYKDGVWTVQYENKFNNDESNKIISVLDKVIETNNLSRNLGYGDLVENRGSQITLSALGQKAPLELKEKWDPDQVTRKKIKQFIDPMLPEFEIRIGGTTSIDITKKGQNKALAINNFIKILKIDKKDLVFYGDALYSGGNDEIVKETNVNCQMVSNPQDTIKALRGILHLYEETNRQSSLG